MFPFSEEELEKGELISVFTVLSVPKEGVWKSPIIVLTLKAGIRPAVCAALSGQEGVGVRKATVPAEDGPLAGQSACTGVTATTIPLHSGSRWAQGFPCLLSPQRGLWISALQSSPLDQANAMPSVQGTWLVSQVSGSGSSPPGNKSCLSFLLALLTKSSQGL